MSTSALWWRWHAVVLRRPNGCVAVLHLLQSKSPRCSLTCKAKGASKAGRAPHLNLMQLPLRPAGSPCHASLPHAPWPHPNDLRLRRRQGTHCSGYRPWPHHSGGGAQHRRPAGRGGLPDAAGPHANGGGGGRGGRRGCGAGSHGDWHHTHCRGGAGSHRHGCCSGSRRRERARMAGGGGREAGGAGWGTRGCRHCMVLAGRGEEGLHVCRNVASGTAAAHRQSTMLPPLHKRALGLGWAPCGRRSAGAQAPPHLWAPAGGWARAAAPPAGAGWMWAAGCGWALPGNPPALRASGRRPGPGRPRRWPGCRGPSQPLHPRRWGALSPCRVLGRPWRVLGRPWKGGVYRKEEAVASKREERAGKKR